MKSYADGKMLAEIEDGIGLITFNQPEKRNAMSVSMWHGLSAILDDMEASPEVRVVVMTGAGHKAFVSGADISQFEQQRADGNAQLEYDRLTSAGRARLAAFPIASVIDLLHKWMCDLIAARNALAPRFFVKQAEALRHLASVLDSERMFEFELQLRRARALADHPLNPRLVIDDLLIQWQGLGVARR